MALKYRKSNTLTLIHHSDRGLQYCANQYQKGLIENKVLSSMTQNSDPYENAVAERINGILKQKFMIDKYHQKIKIKRQIIKESINIYNEQRPHYSNHMLTPNQMHCQNQMQIRTYKNKTVARTFLQLFN
ncbi:transposase InsO family protein [Flavobacterium aquidurense]|nr:transposase InsO family protein [Flavobacterium aquidurense]